MDYTVAYLYKDDHDTDDCKTVLETLEIENKHYILHIHHCYLYLIHLNEVSQIDLSNKQLSDIALNHRKFPQTFTLKLDNKPVSYDYNRLVHELFILDDSRNISTIAKKELIERIRICNGEHEFMEIGDNNDEIFGNLLMKSKVRSQNIDQHFHQSVKGAFQIKTMNNILIVFSKDETLTKILVYHFEKNQRKLLLVPKREHILNHTVPSNIVNFISNNFLYKQILKDSICPSMLLGTNNGCVLNISSICESPCVVYDLRQDIVGIIHITLLQEKEKEEASSVIFSQNKLETKIYFDGYALCFVGEKGKIGIAIFNPNNSFLHFHITQLSMDIECCVSCGNFLIAASTEFVSVYRAEGRVKVSKKQDKSVHTDFIHLKDYKIMNVKQLMISPINSDEVICLNSAQSVMLFNYKSSLFSSKNPQKDISALLEAYSEQNKCNQNLKEISLELSQTLMDVSAVGEWIKMLKNNKTCLSLDTGINRIKIRSRKTVILSLKVSNNSFIATPHVSSLCLQYKKTFRAGSPYTHSETFKCSIPSGLEETFSFEIVEQALDFSPLQFDVYLQFTISSMPTISCFVKTFYLDVLDYCDVTAASIAGFSPEVFKPEANDSLQTAYRCHFALNASKCGSKTVGEFQELIAPVLHIPVKTLQSHSKLLVEHVKGESAEFHLLFERESSSCSLTIRTSNVVFMASLHQHLLKSLKDYVVLKDFEENKIKASKEKLEQIGFDLQTNDGRRKEEIIATLTEIYTNQRQ